MRRALCAGVIFLVGLAVAESADAGPVATVRFRGGRRMRVEVLSFSQGMFRLKSAGGGAPFSAFDRDIESFDFGAEPELRPPAQRTLTPRRLDLDPFRRAVEMRQYGRLIQRVRLAVNKLQDEASVHAFRDELKAELSAGELTREKRRDLKLALTAVYFALRDRWRGMRLLREVKAENPDDAEVKKFAQMLESVRKLAAGAGEKPMPERDPGEKHNERKDNDAPR